MHSSLLTWVLSLCVAATGADAPPAAPVAPAAAAPIAPTPPSPVTPSHAAVDEIGSMRNAKVAIPRGVDAPTLTYFARELSPAQRTEIEKIAPKVQIVAGLSREEVVRRAAEADGADASYATPEFLRAATKLRWVQSQSAGVDRFVAVPEIAANDNIVLTNMRGVHGPAIADHVFAMLLALTRDLPVHLAGRERGRWARDGSGVLAPIALEGRTLLVVGLGGIGTEIARRGNGFGMRVLATRRNASEPRPPFVERVGRPDDLKSMLAEADVVAIALPLTAETTRLFDRAALDAMKKGSYLINIGRGKIVDTDALVQSLQSGHLAGACLDVTDPEPLPPDHALWKMPNVVVTPHVAAAAELTEQRAWMLFRENLRRFDAGEPLMNVVDKRAGY